MHLELTSDFTLAISLLKWAFSAFLGILFLQSGLDKALNFKENLSWLSGHFAESPLSGIVPFLLITISIAELGAGLLSAMGLFQLMLLGEGKLAFYGNILALAALTSLFFGQRLAKDYAGAASLVSYFIAAAAGLLIQAMP